LTFSKTMYNWSLTPPAFWRQTAYSIFRPTSGALKWIIRPCPICGLKTSARRPSRKIFPAIRKSITVGEYKKHAQS